MREEWKLDSQDLKSAVRVDEKRQSLTRGKKRQFGLNDPRVFAHSSSCGFAAAVTRSFRCGGSVDLFVTLFRGKVLFGGRSKIRLKLDGMVFGDTKSQNQ